MDEVYAESENTSFSIRETIEWPETNWFSFVHVTVQNGSTWKMYNLFISLFIYIKN